ncbi:hypothetical protein SAMN02745163_03675 [Clostridium cavendishii DSM 21758]|uniref:Uncharacterized protein n=1 Tax=Clostridium cavendishii DSM 21758 TaxID=1121302 RepID=A0A1M6RV99_9CLOT|nr:hypothetical protein [Clostridium cavendishii]SHK36187.1 hypothetical protein SAMN02745163_03675 [Clostridium cavendishii DSM 21758]
MDNEIVKELNDEKLLPIAIKEIFNGIIEELNEKTNKLNNNNKEILKLETIYNFEHALVADNIIDSENLTIKTYKELKDKMRQFEENNIKIIKNICDLKTKKEKFEQFYNINDN